MMEPGTLSMFSWEMGAVALMHLAGASLSWRGVAWGRKLSFISALLMIGLSGYLFSEAAEGTVLLASFWGMVGGLLMLTPQRFNSKHIAPSTSFLIATLAVAPVGASAWLLGSSPLALRPLMSPSALSLSLLHTSLFAAALGCALIALLSAGQEKSLKSLLWWAVGLLSAIGGMALSAALGVSFDSEVLSLGLVDVNGLPIEVQLTLVDLQQSGSAAVDRALSLRAPVDGLGGLGSWLAGLSILSLVGGAFGARWRAVGGALFLGAGAAWIVIGGLLLSAAGPVDLQELSKAESPEETVNHWRDFAPKVAIEEELLAPYVGVPTPSSEQLLREASRLRLSGKQLLAPAKISAVKGLVHRREVIPPALLCWVLGMLCLLQGAKGFSKTGSEEKEETSTSWPANSRLLEGRVSPGMHLLISRDAMMLSGLFLWISIGLGALASYERFGRTTPDFRVGVFFALALIATASVRAWHMALGRGDWASFKSWMVLPLALLAISLLVVVSGSLTPQAFQALSLFP